MSAVGSLIVKCAVYVPPHASVSPLGAPEAVDGYWRGAGVAAAVRHVASLFRGHSRDIGYIDPGEVRIYARKIGISEDELLGRLRPYSIIVRPSGRIPTNVSVGVSMIGRGAYALSRQDPVESLAVKLASQS